MNTLNLAQITEAGKNAVAEAQSLAASVFGGFEKLVELNLALTKSVLLETTGDIYSVFSAKSPTDALAAQASLVKPLAEKTIAYGRSVYAIASEAGSELHKSAESKLSAGQKNMVSALDTLVQNAPAGTESVVAVFKSTLTTSQAAIESARASAKKAVELMEKQATAVTENALNAVKTTSRAK